MRTRSATCGSAPGLVTAATACLMMAALRGCSGDTLPTAWRQGIATNYGGAQDGMDPSSPSFGTKDGGCGYGLLDKTKFPYWSVAALASSNIYSLQGPVKGCGECFEIQCLDQGQYQGRCNSDPNARSVTVMITDGCPDCEPDHIDIQALTFNKMAPMAVGRVAMQYRRVQCTPPSGLEVVIDQNAGAGGTLRLTIQQAGNLGSIQLVQVQGRNGGWQNMHNTWGAAWEMGQQPTPPLDLRVQDAAGAEVTAFGFLTSNGALGPIPTGVQFSFSATPGATIGSTTSASASASASGSASASASASATVTAFEGPPVSSSSGPSGSPGQSSPPPPSSPGSPPPPGGSSSSQSPPPKPPGASSGSPPPPPPGSSSSSSGSNGGCSDVTPSTGYTCAQHKQWGQCGASWIASSTSAAPKGFCAQTCGRC